MTSTVELQRAYIAALKADPKIMALVGGVYDRVPAKPYKAKDAYISIGPETAVEDDAECITGIEVTTQIDVWTKAVGKVECKEVTDLVRKALHRKPLVLDGAALVDQWVTLTRIMDDPDGITKHGVVQITARIEEPD